MNGLRYNWDSSMDHMSSTDSQLQYRIPEFLADRPIDVIGMGPLVLERVMRVSEWPEPGGQDSVEIHSITDTFGGCATSVCCYFGRLNGKSLLISPIGDDNACNKAHEELSRSGVETRHLSRHGGTDGHLIHIRWDEIKLADGHKFTVPDLVTDADISADKGKRTE